jgi:hypothetical protein
LRAGQYLEATISSKTTPSSSWSLPAAALVRNGGRDYVMVQAAGGVQPVAVNIITHGTDKLIVQGALKAGQQVAIQGLANLKGIWLGLGSATPGAQ